MLEELDQAALDLNISRQAVIKTLIRQALDRHYLAAAEGNRVRSRDANEMERATISQRLAIQAGATAA